MRVIIFTCIQLYIQERVYILFLHICTWFHATTMENKAPGSHSGTIRMKRYDASCLTIPIVLNICMNFSIFYFTFSPSPKFYYTRCLDLKSYFQQNFPIDAWRFSSWLTFETIPKELGVCLDLLKIIYTRRCGKLDKITQHARRGI